MDLGLPDLPGEKLVTELRSLYPQLRIIVASGKGADLFDGVLEPRPDLVILPKPYDFEDLRTAIGRLEPQAET